MGRVDSKLEGLGERLGETMKGEGESEVEVIKKEVRVVRKKSRGKGDDGNEVGSKCQHQKGQSRNHVEKVTLAGDDNLGDRRQTEMTQLYQPTKVLEENVGEREEIMWPDLDADRDDQLGQSLESDIDAKLKELKLKSQSKRGGFEKELEPDSQSSSPAVVEVEEMTSEDYYHDPLGHYAVHEETLKDESRMLIWQEVS